MNVNTEEQRDEMIDEIARSRRINTDYYAVSNEVRLGRYPGEVVSTHPSHWEAVQAMFRLNEAAGMDDRVDDPCEEYPDYGPTDPSPPPCRKINPPYAHFALALWSRGAYICCHQNGDADMHCTTSSRPIFDMTQHPHPRALHVECLRFIKGIRGPRASHVTRKQIGDWLRRTPSEAVDAALIDLIAEGKISAGFTSLRYGNTARRATGYWVTT